MATYAITGNTNMDALTAKGGADTYNVNGGTLTQDRDTRNGVNPSNSHGNINGSPTLGGTIKFRSDKVRWIYFTGGSGNVPAYETAISQGGGASGLLIGVHSSVNSAPITPGSAMPASGYIRVTQWNSVAYASGALTGITATCAADPVFGTYDRAGFIIVVGRDATNTNISRLNNPIDDVFLGDWFMVGITDGNRSTAYQIPGNGDAMYFGGVEVETAPGSGVYEWWPVTTSAMTAYNLRTTGEASKQCWINPATAQVRFGHDGTNSTGGACPASGCKVRIPNLFLQGCTAGAPTVNAFSAIGSRHYFYANGAGRWRMTGVSSSWRQNLVTNAYEVYAKDSSFCQSLTISSNATPYELDNVCVSTPVDDGIANSGLVLSSSFIGGTVVDSVFSVGKIDAVNKNPLNITSSSNGSFDNCKFLFSGMPTTAPSAINSSIAENFDFQNCYFVGKQTHSQSVSFVAQNCTFGGVTPGAVFESSSGVAFLTLSNKSSEFLYEDWTFPETETLGKSSFITLSGSSTNNKFRNMGTYASPVSGKSATQYDLDWTRSGSTITVTWTGHPFRTNDYAKVLFSTSAAATGSGGLELVTYLTANTFSFVGAASGDALGKVTLFRAGASSIIDVAAGCSGNEFQNIFVDGAYTGSLNAAANGNDNLYLNISGGIGSGNTFAGNDMIARHIFMSASIPGASAAQYGHTFVDGPVQTSPSASGGIADTYNRTGAVAVITHTDHGIENASTRIRFYDPSDTGTFVPTVAWKYATPLTKDTFSVPVVNTGAASGTVSWDAPTDKVTLFMNEQSDTVQRYTIDSGTPAFTGAGALSAVTVGDQITWEMPEFLINYTGFANMPIETSLAETLAAQGVYRFMYDIAVDDGAFSGTFKNLSLILTQTSGVSGTPTMTFASTANIQAGDKITGAHIPRGAYVVSVDSATQITISANLLGTATGDYMFNHLPNETFTTNFKLKVRQITLTANTLSNTYINIPLTSDATSRAEVYPIAVISFNQEVQLDGLAADYRVYIKDETSNTVLANELATGATFEWVDPDAYVANRQIRLRVSYKDADEAIVFTDRIIGTAINDSVGRVVSYTLTPEDDVVYNANAIDGDTVTTVVFDEDNDRIELDGATEVIDGETVSVNDARDIYAAQVAWLYTEDGIAGYGQRITAVDQANYFGESTKFKNVSAYPGYISNGWVRNTTSNNALTLIDFTATYPISFAPDHVVNNSTTTPVVTGDASDIIAAVPSASANATAVAAELADDFDAIPTAAENATAVQSQLNDDFDALPTAAEAATAVQSILNDDFAAVATLIDALPTASENASATWSHSKAKALNAFVLKILVKVGL